MSSNVLSPLSNLALRLKSLRDQDLATRILWLVSEGNAELLPNGDIGFWTDHRLVMRVEAHPDEQLELRESIAVDPSWVGPNEAAALWCSVEPENVLAVEHDSRGVARLVLNRLVVKLVVLSEEDEEIIPKATSRSRRKGPARLYPRLGRPNAA